MEVKVIGGEISREEKQAYIERAIDKYGDKVTALQIEIDPNDNNYVKLYYEFNGGKPFMRLRRITGYLVGHMSRWNNAKRAEEGDRVKHGV